MEELTNYIDTLPGFKMPGAHFRIGTKIHISDFYYAKRFFQNGFFATRIAFQVTRYIIENHLVRLSDEERKKLKKDGLTLVGYGLYSELLLSLVEQFLRKTVGIRKINHNIIDDLDDAKFVKHYQTTNPLVIIIVPIASTFSTSFKMDEIIYREKPDAIILEPHINVTVIVNKSLRLEGIKDIEKQFNWKHFDQANSLIDVDPIMLKDKKNVLLPDVSSRKAQQLYFLLLESEWQDVDNCVNCFHTPPIEELPLIVTDKTNVTPALIFEFPTGRVIEDHNQREFKLSADDINYHHAKRGLSHYLFYIRIDRFFESSKPAISTWLKLLKKSKEFKHLCRETDQVVIVAPGHYSNAGFVNLVNELLFSNAANILHYDPSTDHIQNFQLFYKHEINGKNQRLFFVDDTIITGSTFIKTNYYIKHTRDDLTAFDGCIILLDRSSDIVHKNVLRKLRYESNSFFSYASLHLPSLKEVDQECPLCREKERYEKLAEGSFLDKLKVHFLAQAAKLRIKDLATISLDEQQTKKQYANKRKIEATHRIFQWFTLSPDVTEFKFLEFYPWLEKLLTQTASPFEEAVLRTFEPSSGSLSMETLTVLKLLTQSPFTYYRPLKGKIFEWVLRLLIDQCNFIRRDLSKHSGNEPHFLYHAFRDFKFLVRRAGLLNSNYLIHSDFLDFLRLIFSDAALHLLEVDCATRTIGIMDSGIEDTEDYKSENVRDFNVFFVAQIKELLFLNEAKSIHLEELLFNYENSDPHILRSFSRKFNQLLRLLSEENGILIAKFWEMIAKENLWQDTHLPAAGQIEKIKESLQSDAIAQHYRFKALEKFLMIRKQPPPAENPGMLNFLCLMNFLSKEKADKYGGLSEKTNFMVNRLREIIRDEADEPGIFMIIKFPTGAENPYFFARNEYQGGSLNEKNWRSEGFDYIENFLEGVKDSTDQSCKTIVEFHLKDGKWEDMYAIVEDAWEPRLSPELFAEEIDRLLLLRINKRQVPVNDRDEEKSEDVPQAVIGFFFKKNKAKTVATSICKLRLLLLLRSAISEFIQNHHENDEFRDWIEASNKQRTALLTGHGREMLIDLARNKKHGNEYKQIVHTILLLQRFILDLEDAKKAGLESSAVIHVFKQIFHPVATELKTDFLEQLKNRCRAIFEFEEIENTEAIEVTGEMAPGTLEKFIFPPDIIDMACFELFVNAKKNRWLFTTDDDITDEEGRFITQNQVYIEVKRYLSAALNKEDSLLITIRNTGPYIGKEISKLQNNQYHNVKGNNQVAGIGLISQLLEDFKLGSLEFESQKPAMGSFTFFEVKLKLYNWYARKN